MTHPSFRDLSSCARRLRETLNRARFVVVHFENRGELGDLQRVAKALDEMEQLELPCLICHGYNPPTSSPIPVLSM